MLRSALVCAALALTAAAALGCADEGVPIAVPHRAGCNPLSGTDSCALPFPSSFAEAADRDSPTGVRVSLDPETLPKRDGVTPFDVAPYVTADGFSPVTPILVHFGADVDPSGLPGFDAIGSSLEAGSNVALLDVVTGERVPVFAEMDQNVKDDYPGHNPLIVHAMRPMVMGHRHVVAIRTGLSDTSGRPIASPPVFAALRDRVATGDAEIEALRARTEPTFAFLEAHGLPRAELLVAWDFQVASADYLLGSVLSMRAEALAMIGDKGLAYTIESVADDPSEHVARIVEGEFEVPTFVRDDDTFEYDAAHHPVRQVKNRSYPYTMVIPAVAKQGAPLPLVVIGHGIFGEGRGFLTGGGDGQALQTLADQLGGVLVATDWIGLSAHDLPRLAAEVAPDLGRLGLVTDQLQQALINTLTMTKLARGSLAVDPKVALGPAPLLDGRTFYWGASLGGIEGTSFVSISDEIAHAAFGVPGCAWSTMLARSIVFPPLRAFLEPHYPDPLDFVLLTAMVQARFDHSDPANLGKLMFERPLPDAPKDRLAVWQEAIGDSQVPNLTTEILARSLGLELMSPSVTEPFGLAKAADATKSPALAQYRLPAWDMPAPPDGDLAPASDNGVHHDMNFLPNVHQQIEHLFFDGEITQYCSGSCDPD